MLNNIASDFSIAKTISLCPSRRFSAKSNMTSKMAIKLKDKLRQMAYNEHKPIILDTGESYIQYGMPRKEIRNGVF